MKIAIIGAGFCGLSLAHFLLQSGVCQVTLFDHNGVGGGASGIATGLLHPYPGEQGRRSWRATEAIAATLSLAKDVQQRVGKAVAQFDGIVRVVQNQEQEMAFEGHIQRYQDVERIDKTSFLIKSGVTIHCQTYLQGLADWVIQAGGIFKQEKVHSLDDLSQFDQVILAAGSGLADFPEAKSLKVSSTKGQILVAQVPDQLQSQMKSMICKGYLAKGDNPQVCYLGSTYEKPFDSIEPDVTRALTEIIPKISFFFPSVNQLEIVECRAGVRISRIGHYYPIIAQLAPHAWAITAMGSRGLLYHAYLSKFLAEAICTGNADCIPQEILTNCAFKALHA